MKKQLIAFSVFSLCTLQSTWATNAECKTESVNKEAVTAIAPPATFTNPILPGYHPDPSICRVGDTYYMVNSSFEWWPCMPIHRSKDLVNWELIGYGKVDPAKLPVKEGTGNSGGIFAVTIRHHEGLFYLITTMIGGGGNFYITTADPTGEWSDPVWLKSEGIDPSLFWDDNGKCYYVGHGYPSPQLRPSHCMVWAQELDLKQGKLVGERHQLTDGHAQLAAYSEGPHIYKHNGKYVLIISEGGTEHNHSVTQFYSDSIFGPYVANQINPILTHRHLGNQSHIKCTGHADIVETQNGEWWMVALGMRNFDGKTYLARETFLTPMEWEETYGNLGIVVNRGHGQILKEQKRPNLPWTPVKQLPARDDFESKELTLYWNMLRSPIEKWYSIEKGKMIFNVRPQTVNEFVNPSLLARRIQDIRFSASTQMTFKSKKVNEEAGLILYRDTKAYISFTKQGKQLVVKIMNNGELISKTVAEIKSNDVKIKMNADGENVNFSYSENGEEWTQTEISASLFVIGDSRGGQFNGPMIGIYASSNGKLSRSKAIFDWFEYAQ